MTEKETLIARLKELGVKLDREVNVTGTIQELTLRISELEEELDEDGEEGGGVRCQHYCYQHVGPAWRR
jgi:hypothetical protein